MVYEKSVVAYVKGVILAGGTGSRLYPLTKVTNKHLLPVYDEPMIYKSIRTLVNSGIRDIVIVLGGENVGDFIKLLGDGADFCATFTYVYQQRAGGIAEALNLTKHILKGHHIAVILGDNIFEDTFEKEVIDFRARFGFSEHNTWNSQLFLKEVDDPERFGVAEIENDEIISIEEKPKNPKSNYAVTGLYFFDTSIYDVIEKVINETGYSERGELEITDVNKYYLKNASVGFKIIDGFWSDAGTLKTLIKSSNFIMKKNM